MLSYEIKNKSYLQTYDEVRYIHEDDEIPHGYAIHHQINDDDYDEIYSFIEIDNKVLVFEDEDKMQSFLDVYSFIKLIKN